MQVVATLSRKGGSAKSTCCRSFAVQALLEGKRSAIVDADDQATCVNWAKRRTAQVPVVMPPGNKGVANALDELARKKVEVAFVDTPPTIHPVISIALDAAKSCIIVTEPLPESIETVAAMARIVERLNKPAAIIITRVPIRSAALTLAKGVLTAFDIPVCPFPMSNLIVHSHAAAEGLTAQEREPKGKAAQEIKQIWDWLSGNRIL